MLKDFIKREALQTGVKASTWEEAIDLAGAPLIKTGAIKPSYLETIKRHHVEMGPYMVVAPGIMLSHARPEDGAEALALGFTTLASPIKFGSDLNDPVRLVITLATPDDHAHLKMLEALTEFLMDGEKTAALMDAASPEEAEAVFKDI